MYPILRHIILSIVFLTGLHWCYAQENPVVQRPIPIIQDSGKVETPVVVTQEALVEQDSTAQDTTKPKAFLQYKLESSAKGYNRFDRRQNTLTLYDQAIIVYGDIRLEAGKIIINNNTGNVYAYGIVEDSTNAYVQKPIFTQGANKVEPDSIIFNKDTKKALTYNSKTAQGEFNVVAEITKKVNDSVFFMRNARFTTSSNPENPEYYFLARKIKFVPKKKIVTGLVNMYIADVPTPLGLPFAFFPMTNERRSGIILPSFGNDNNRGYNLTNGGYYFAINDYVDLTVLGDYFTNGSYGARVESSYRKRYKYSGSIRFLLEESIRSERGFSDFAQTGRYNINWQHSQDANASPNSRFSASVNLGSPDFYRNSFNQTNQSAQLINNLSSSISYSKTFPGEPQVNLNTTVSINQNVNTNTTNLTLPTFQGSVSRVFPFASEGGLKKGIIQNINLQYNVRGENRATTTNDNLFTPDIFKDARAGIQHSIPISTNFKIAKYFSVSTGASFQENWVFDTIDQTLVANESGNQVIRRDTISGFDSYRTYSFNASLGTTIYGSFTSSNPEAKIQAVRHVIRPSVSYNINPSFDQYYERLLREDGVMVSDEERFFSRFEGTLFGAPGRVFSSNIGLSIQNNLEAKVLDPDSEDGELKKKQWIKSLNISTSYNLAGDSLQLSPLNLSGVIPIYKDVDLQLNANFDPYALDANNQRINTFNINNGGSLARLTNAGARFNFKLDSKDFEKGAKDEDDKETKVESTTLRNGGRADDLFGDPIDPATGNFLDDEEPTQQDVDLEDSLYRFKIPWNLNIAYTFTYNNARRQNEISGNSIMLSGDVEFSPRWSIGGNTGYDFVGKGVSFTTIRFQRDLESFRMSFNWNPIGVNNSWFFFIGIKSGALSDIKYDQRRQPDPRF
ncbi:organic solvent tolerance protein OstA [Nonlabens sp. YIK11]|uniref:putative LPS assembly protein LptD n=1 Tax=Nonlabens sp. YIK11 TaxID=1453349 RepID=UPI0006DCD1AE|nr:putative LPS assembly protein LptD [Nonlabens sp. YIK11]KQC33845.1 organic solvent tolerance protein OstA [Nonlabens sp. YIK11]